MGHSGDRLLAAQTVIFTSVEAVAGYLDGLPFSPQRRFVGITGAPGAGKSTIALALMGSLRNAALLPMDGFHLPQATLVELGRRDRMGAPDTFDVEGLLLTLEDLARSGGPVFAPSFDRDVEEPVADGIAIQPTATTIVVEGNYLLLDSGAWAKVGPLLDVSFFVDVSPHIRHRRLIERHERFGKSPDAARAWALGPDESNAQTIAATASRADHVIRLD